MRIQEELKRIVGNYPGAKSADFVIELREFVLNLSREKVVGELVPLIDVTTLSSDVRFAALYAAYTYYRRSDARSDLCDLVKAHGSEFSQYALSNVMYSQFYYAKFLEEGDLRILDLALEQAKQAKCELTDNYAVLLNYSVLVADALERDARYEELIEEALESVEIALCIKPYAKSYYAKGRLLARLGDYECAQQCVNKAIDLESFEGPDAQIRIAKYNILLLEIKTLESLDCVEKSIVGVRDETDRREAEMVSKLDVMQSRYIELLVFFSSVLAVIIAVVGFTGGVSFSFAETCGIVLVMGSILLLSYSALRLVVFEKRDRIALAPSVIALVAFIVVAVIGFVIGKVFA